MLTRTSALADHEVMVDDESDAPHDDYDLLTHYEAGKRLTDHIEQERGLCDESAEGDLHRARLAALEDAAKRHREYRPADHPTFFNADGVVKRVDTAVSKTADVDTP